MIWLWLSGVPAPGFEQPQARRIFAVLVASADATAREEPEKDDQSTDERDEPQEHHGAGVVHVVPAFDRSGEEHPGKDGVGCEKIQCPGGTAAHVMVGHSNYSQTDPHA